MEHAKLSPSSSGRWLQCTASVEACKPYPDTTNSASEWGTACHGLGELMLLDKPFPKTGEIFNDVTDEGEIRSSTEVDVEMINTAMQYVEYCRDLTGKDAVKMVETRFDLSFIAPETFGTGDYSVLNDEHLDIVDLKTGHGIVWAEENTQLMLYALGAIHELEDLYDIKTVTLHIMQSRANHIDTWSTTVQDLLAFERFAKEQASIILYGKDVTYEPSDSACKWCDHKVDCVALRTHIDDVMTGEFDDLTDIDGKADDIPQDHIKAILDNKDLITSFIKAVESRALEMAEAGEHISGYKMVRGRRNMAWTDVEKAEVYLLRKLKQEGTYKKTIITPTQAVKALGKDNKFIQKLMARPEGAITLAPLSDKREEVKAVTEGFEEL